MGIDKNGKWHHDSVNEITDFQPQKRVPKEKQTWRDVKMPFGKYKGRTIDEIRHIDLGYCLWAAEEMTTAGIRELFLCALEYQERVDPGPMQRYQRRNEDTTPVDTYMKRRSR